MRTIKADKDHHQCTETKDEKFVLMHTRFRLNEEILLGRRKMTKLCRVQEMSFEKTHRYYVIEAINAPNGLNPTRRLT